MIDYLIGVDGGGTGTRVRLRRCGEPRELAQGMGGPSGLGLGIERAWAAIAQTIQHAFQAAGLSLPPRDRIAMGLGLAGVHNELWAQEFVDANPGYAVLALETDAYTTLLGAHGGQAGTIIAIGTGSVGEVLLPDGTRREVGGWGFPAGDEAGGAWIGLQAINHIQQVLDGRKLTNAFADSVIAACGGGRDAIQAWLGQATPTSYASLAPLVLKHAHLPVAHTILQAAGREAAAIATTLDPSGALPLALCGGLGAALRDWLPVDLAARVRAPLNDSAAGALRMIALHLERRGTP
jgi:glucosamine kinase